MRARPLAVAGACLSSLVTVVAVGVGTSPAGAVSTAQSFQVPGSKTLVVRGHGFGHGHGMSQYGAEGAAAQGLDYRQIAGFYYPGTAWSEVRGNVRVLISADTTRDVIVSPAAGLKLRDLGSGTTYPLPDIAGVNRWRLNVGAGNATVVGYRTDRWHRWSPGGRPALVGDGQFSASGPLTLWAPDGPHRYRGALRAASPAAGSADRDTVNVLSVDSYLKGVVPQEMPASWRPEAVKAQAVAARTYAAWSRGQDSRRYYQICDTTSCQVYGGYDAEDPRSNAAVDATARQILTYQGRPAFTQFSSSDGGWTSAGSVPYLPARQDPYDGFAGNPVHDWTAKVDATRLERAYPAIGSLQRIDVVSRDGNGDWSGRGGTMVLRGTKADRTLSGDDFRFMFGLRSSWFTIDPVPTVDQPPAAPTGPTAPTAARADAPTPTAARSTAPVRPLTGPILTAYREFGGTRSTLGRPLTRVYGIRGGQKARFQHGVMWRRWSHDAVAVVRPAVVRRYVRAGGIHSKLGWPTRTNVRTRAGEQVRFQHGVIAWNRAMHRTTVRLTR
ncbi:MAG: SpoIID/LytB domain-containing protein [Nocardioidaceae bacterium]